MIEWFGKGVMPGYVSDPNGCVDEVLSSPPPLAYQTWIETHGIDVVIHGDDLSKELEELCSSTPIKLGTYRTVSYTEGISTTEIISRINAAETG